ncbi:MAG: tyrosine-type recombinase/integrase [Verrucomicrobia bacterium]|nr:tyrosine-type recombinase/integrase [Verrucomicrobiota bacterium]
MLEYTENPPSGGKTLNDLLADFLEHNRALNYSERTNQDYTRRIGHFLKWMETHHQIAAADQLTRQHLDTWLRSLHSHRTPRGLPFKVKTARLWVAVVRSFMNYLARMAYVHADLPEVLVAPKDEQLLPTSVLNHAQVKKLLSRVNTHNTIGYRDRAILELLYSSGIRAAELLGLDVGDVDLQSGTAKVTGKGRKQRVVPIGRTALKFLETYLVAIRPFMTKDDPTEQALFINYQGERLRYSGLRRLVHVHSAPLGFDVPVSAHTFRRSCTTELIRGGANMYHVKELLGHESLDMLKPYTKLTIQDLKKTHEKCHPREQQSDQP